MKMQSVWLLTVKNVKLVLRAKSSALIVFFAPLLTILILGLSFNTTSQYGLNIGIYSPSFSEDVNAFSDSLQQQNFRVVKYETSIEECIEDIKVGAVHTCISVPESLKVEGNTPQEVIFYVDPSRINLVWMIQETVQSEFNLRSRELSQDLTQGVLDRLDTTKTQINERKNEVSDIKEKSSTASSSTVDAKEALATIDLTSSTTGYDSSAVNGFTSNISASLNLSKDKIDDANAALSDANISSADRATIKDFLDDAEQEIEKSLSLVTGNGDNSVGEIKSLIATLEADLNKTKSKLDAAAETVAGASTNLDSVASTISESVSSLDSLQSSLDTIYKNLEAQPITEAATISAPLVTKIEKVTPDSTYLNYSFSTLLVVVVMFTSLLLGTILVMMEKNSPAFLRNYFLPIRKTTFIISTYLTTIALIVVQIIVILLIALFFLSGAGTSLPAIALILFLCASVFAFLGMAVGYVFLSEETGVLASISVGSVLLFMSGVILPIETISPALREVAAFSPFVISEKVIREIFIFNSPLSGLLTEIGILVGYTAVLFIVVLVIESLLHQHLVRKFMKYHHNIYRQKDKEVQSRDI